MFSYVWFEQPIMAKQELSNIQRLSCKRNSFTQLIYLSWRKCHGKFATYLKALQAICFGFERLA
jgi:hypothetical protein